MSPCRAIACAENHQSHYCRFCHERDATHLSSHCPTQNYVYHATSADNLASILTTGFRASTDGRLGPGVYFAPHVFDATRLALARYPKGGVVIYGQIPKGKQKNLWMAREDADRDTLTSWQKEGYTSAWGRHPSWLGNSFDEICILDCKDFYLRGVSLVVGSYTQDLIVPKGEIKVYPGFTATGKLAAMRIWKDHPSCQGDLDDARSYLKRMQT